MCMVHKVAQEASRRTPARALAHAVAPPFGPYDCGTSKTNSTSDPPAHVFLPVCNSLSDFKMIEGTKLCRKS